MSLAKKIDEITSYLEKEVYTNKYNNATELAEEAINNFELSFDETIEELVFEKVMDIFEEYKHGDYYGI